MGQDARPRRIDDASCSASTRPSRAASRAGRRARHHPSPVSGPSHSATFAFAAHAGDTATVSFECSIDGGQFNLVHLAQTYPGSRCGEHVFRVHGVNATATSAPPPPPCGRSRTRAAPDRIPRVGLPAVAVAGPHASRSAASLGHRQDRPVRGHARDSPAASSSATACACSTARTSAGTARSRSCSPAKGRKLAAQPGGVHVVATAAVSPVGGSTPLVAKQTVHVVSSQRRRDAGRAAVPERLGGAPARPAASYLLRPWSGSSRAPGGWSPPATPTASAAPRRNYRLGLARADAVCAFISHRAHVACRARLLRRGPPPGDQRHRRRPRAQPARRAPAHLLARNDGGDCPRVPGTVPTLLFVPRVQARYAARR